METKNPTNAVVAADPEFIDCKVAGLALHPPASEVNEHLPSGFEAVGIVPGTADLNLEIWNCVDVVIDNRTVLANVGYAMVVSFVRAPAEIQANGVPNVFVLEAFANNQTFLGAMRARGLDVALADIVLEADATGQESVRVEVSGGVRYEGQENGYAGEQVPDSGLIRKHHFDGLTGLSSYWYNTTERFLRQSPLTFHLEVEGGLLAELTPGPSGSQVGYVGSSNDSGRFDFLQELLVTA